MTSPDSIRPEPAGPSDRSDIVELLDRVFVLPGGRHPSFAVRHPSAFVFDEHNRAWIIRESGKLQACVLVKRRQWRVGDRECDLAMIGGVCTDPAARRRGYGSNLVGWAAARAADDGATNVVLFSNLHAFYGRLGWQLEDGALLGTMRQRPPGKTEAEADVLVLEPGAARESLEGVRPRVDGWVERRPIDYESVPFPAVTVECLYSEAGKRAAYALVGRREQTGYLYELRGSEAGYSSICSAIRSRFTEIRINARAGSSTAAWLDAHESVEWETRQLAMWLGRPRGHVPYFDRI